MQKPLSDDVFSQQTLKFFANLCILTAAVGTKIFKIYPSVYNNFRHLCFFTRWLSSDFQRVQQRPASVHLHRRSSQVRNHSGAGHAGLPSPCQAREIFFQDPNLVLMGSDYYSLGLKFKVLKLKYS